MLFNLLSSNCYFHLEEGIDGSVVTDITAEDLSEMGLTLKLGTRKNSCLSYRTWANHQHLLKMGLLLQHHQKFTCLHQQPQLEFTSLLQHQLLRPTFNLLHQPQLEFTSLLEHQLLRPATFNNLLYQHQQEFTSLLQHQLLMRPTTFNNLLHQHQLELTSLLHLHKLRLTSNNS